MSASAVFVLILLVVVLFLLYAGVKTVPQGYEWTVERFGRYTRTLSPGLHLLAPMVDRVGRKVSMQETVLEVPKQDVITRDNALVKADGIVFFQVVDAAAAAYEVRNLIQAITQLALTNIRAVIGSLDLDETLSHRDQINERLLRVVDSATSAWGVKVTRIEIKDLLPPADISQSMARQMKAERERRAEILIAEGLRQAAILKAEGAKQAAILEAEGRREAAFRDAEAREREAAAEAKATQLVSDAISAGNVNALNYFVAQRYVGAIQALASAPNQRVILMPVEATALIGSLGGIAELARASFGGDGPSGPPPARPERPRARPAAAPAIEPPASSAVPPAPSPEVATFLPPEVISGPPVPPPPATPGQGPWSR